MAGFTVVRTQLEDTISRFCEYFGVSEIDSSLRKLVTDTSRHHSTSIHETTVVLGPLFAIIGYYWIRSDPNTRLPLFLLDLASFRRRLPISSSLAS